MWQLKAPLSLELNIKFSIFRKCVLYNVLVCQNYFIFWEEWWWKWSSGLDLHFLACFVWKYLIFLNIWCHIQGTFVKKIKMSKFENHKHFEKTKFGNFRKMPLLYGIRYSKIFNISRRKSENEDLAQSFISTIFHPKRWNSFDKRVHYIRHIFRKLEKLIHTSGKSSQKKMIYI